MSQAVNIFDEPLMLCCGNTGFTREGFCYVPPSDVGNHSVCMIATDEFLQFSQYHGNDLITPQPNYGIYGLKAGDKWCLCALRWEQARLAGVAPLVDLKATNKACLDIIKLEHLLMYDNSSR